MRRLLQVKQSVIVCHNVVLFVEFEKASYFLHLIDIYHRQSGMKIH
jgi:hypothetical protein